MRRADRLSLLGGIRPDLSPPVTAIGIKGNACRVGERPYLGAFTPRVSAQGREICGQCNPCGFGFNAAAKDLVHDPGATRVRDPEAHCRRGHFAEQSRRHTVVAEHDLGIAVKAARDFIIMELDLRIPIIHELREVRESQPLQLQQRSQSLALFLGRDFGLDAIDTHFVAGGPPLEGSGVSPSLMLPGWPRLLQIRALLALCSLLDPTRHPRLLTTYVV